MVAALPIDVGRNEIHIAGIFRVAAPGVAHVVEVIRPEHMTSQAPAAGESLVGHLHGPEPDLVNRAVDLRGFEPLTSAVQAPARVDGATASKGVVTSALLLVKRARRPSAQMSKINNLRVRQSD